jgi:toxin ParE1/3/4
MKVRIRARARQDLDAILEYTIVEHGEAQADAYLRTIGTALGRLADYPELGLARPELTSAMRSYPVAEHRIFYMLLPDRISVVRVLHKAMDAARHL